MIGKIFSVCTLICPVLIVIFFISVYSTIFVPPLVL
jgi:hypothetical protein